MSHKKTTISLASAALTGMAVLPATTKAEAQHTVDRQRASHRNFPLSQSTVYFGNIFI